LSEADPIRTGEHLFHKKKKKKNSNNNNRFHPPDSLGYYSTFLLP